MNTTQMMETAWDQMKRQLKQRFGALLYADLAYAENKQDLMFKNLRIKLGKSEEEFRRIVAAL